MSYLRQALLKNTYFLSTSRKLLLYTRTIQSFSTSSVRNDEKNVGFIGLGNMGHGMVKNLMTKSKYKVHVYDLNKDAIDVLVKEGAIASKGPAHMAKLCDTIITMVPTSVDVKKVYCGENGIFSAVRKNALLIDSTTMEPTAAQEMSTLARTKYSSRFIDAPVSGGVLGANAGTLTFMIGGPEADFEEAKPIVLNMGKAAFLCGDIGSGQIAKICNNMLLAISMMGVSEAMNLGMSLGLDKKRLCSIINASSGRCWSSEIYPPVPGLLPHVPSSKEYAGGFRVNLISKDLGLAQACANENKIPIPLGSMANQFYRLLWNNGFGHLDFSVIYKFLQDNSAKK